MPDMSGNAEQTRIVAEQVADTAIRRFVSEHPEVRKTEIPSPLKWAAGMVASLMMLGIGGTATWLVSTVNNMQVTLAEVAVRLEAKSQSDEASIEEIKRRVSVLESYHANGRGLVQ